MGQASWTCICLKDRIEKKSSVSVSRRQVHSGSALRVLRGRIKVEKYESTIRRGTYVLHVVFKHWKGIPCSTCFPFLYQPLVTFYNYTVCLKFKHVTQCLMLLIKVKNWCCEFLRTSIVTLKEQRQWLKRIYKEQYKMCVLHAAAHNFQFFNFTF